MDFYVNRLIKLLENFNTIKSYVLVLDYDGFAIKDINETDLGISSNTYHFFDVIEKDSNPEFQSKLVLANVKLDEVYQISKRMFELRSLVIKEYSNKGRVGVNKMLEKFNNQKIIKS